MLAQVRDLETIPEEDVADNPPAYEEAEANARLIAAAPELLAALRAATEIIETIGNEANSGAALRAARTAIAKATGD